MYNVSNAGRYSNYGASSSNIQSSRSAASVSLTPSMLGALNGICQGISARTKLSTTGYQTAMLRLSKPNKSDDKSVMTLRRAQEYTDAAKRHFSSSSPLAGLAKLQKEHINGTLYGGLVSPIHMDESQLTQCLQRCRNAGFSNCDMQAMEVAMHLRHKLGVTNFTIVSNSKLSHNYVVIDPSDHFPKGAIVDTWTGHGFVELSLKNKLKFEHKANYLATNQTMRDWVERYGASYLIN